MPRNIWVLMCTQALAMSCMPAMIFISGLLGAKISPNIELATLPMTLMIVGSACATIFAAWIKKVLGRKKGGLIGLAFTLSGILIAMLAALYADFNLLLLGSFVIGISLAFLQQLRFAAIESVDASEAGTAVSWLMMAGIVAAFLGPELAVFGKDLLPSPHGYAGSFLILAVTVLIAILVFCFFQTPKAAADIYTSNARSLINIVKNPLFLIAVAAGASAYAVMSLIMTATPISMHQIDGHGLQETKWVIQSHIAAMFLPSLFTAQLIKKIGLAKLLLIGTVLLAVTLAVAFAGQALMHYWVTLVLLGVGWNFLFVGGTTLLSQTHNAQESFKVQASNEFIVFGMQALGSLSAGWLLFRFGWTTLVSLCVPIVVCMFIAAVYYIFRK